MKLDRGVLSGSLGRMLRFQTWLFLLPSHSTKKFPMVLAVNHLRQQSNHSFAFWFSGMRNPKWPSGSHITQLNEITVVSRVGRSSPLEIKISKPTELKVSGKQTFDKWVISVYSESNHSSTYWNLDLFILAIEIHRSLIGLWCTAYKQNPIGAITK